MLKTSIALAAGAACLVAVGSWAFSPARAAVEQDRAPISGPAADPIAAVISENTVISCDVGDADAAAANASSLSSLSWSPFGRAERGWETYAPMVAEEIGAACGVETPGFARELASWEEANGMNADGRMDSAVFDRMKNGWQGARPFVAIRAEGICPAPPSDAQLTTLSADEGYMGKRVQLRSEVAAAYRAMIAAAKAEVPEIAADPEAMDLFSGYRSPEYDDARCARDGNCGGITRAKCSAHRTGTVFDLVVGHAPGHSVDSTNDENRRFMSQTPAYRWMVKNAGRFGFVNYVFEPWHWEYIGEPAAAGVVQASVN